MNKRISIVGSNGIPSNYGGFETLVEFIVKNKSERVDYTVYCSKKKYKTLKKHHNGAKLEYINLNANGYQSIFYDIISIVKSLKKSDIILILGVSGCIILPFIRLFSKCKIITNIDGIEWKRNKWNFFVKLFLKLSETFAVLFSNAIVVDNLVLKKYISDYYSKSSEFISYGGDHTSKIAINKSILKKYNFLRDDYYLTVCRIVPENNIEMIINSFVESKKNLVIVGNWKSSKYSKKLLTKYERFSNISMVNPIYDLTELDVIRSNCKAYIHGHSAGGTNPSLVEAMFLGAPIFAFDVDFNRSTTHSMAIFFSTSKDLTNQINNVSVHNLSKISENMKKIANKNYRWSNISNLYENLFFSIS